MGCEIQSNESEKMWGGTLESAVPGHKGLQQALTELEPPSLPLVITGKTLVCGLQSVYFEIK